MSCLDDKISELPYGLKTKVGNDGVRLSGGEKQRVALARSIYRNPNIFFRVSTGINAKKVEPLEVYLEKNLIKLIEFHKNSDNHIKTEVFQKLAKL